MATYQLESVLYLLMEEEFFWMIEVHDTHWQFYARLPEVLASQTFSPCEAGLMRTSV